MPKSKSKSRLEKDAPIAIVGCGIAGLSAAISLADAGFSNVSIFERDASQSLRREGFGLTLTYNPKGPLERLGILERVAQEDCPSRSHYVFAPDGTVLGYYGNAFSPGRGFGQRGNLRIPRQKLQKIMTDRLTEILEQRKNHQESSQFRIYWGHTLSCILDSKEAGKVQLQFMHAPMGSVDTNTTNETVDDNVDNINPIETMRQTADPITRAFELVIASDGVHSSVVQALAPQCQPRQLHVMIILGIAENFRHPLLTERGFYVVDGKHRLFTMPYEGDKYATNRRIMWQLSYRYEESDTSNENVDSNESDRFYLESKQYRNPVFLRDLVLEKCSHWHEIVPSMIKATPLETIWGTPLLDRSPNSLQKAFQSTSRIVCIGDALHAMSPFKGQGANNALLDGPLIVDWLQRANIDAAVRGIWRETVQRTDKIVAASREAAGFWHSPACIPGREQSPCQFAGVQENFVDKLLKVLSERHITASLSGELDDSIFDVIQELEFGTSMGPEGSGETIDGQMQSAIFKFASTGANADLRKLSLQHASAIRLARDEDGRTTLHLAAQQGHHETCRWLLTEVLADPWAVDSLGRSPFDDASNPETILLLRKVMSMDCKGQQTIAI